MSRSSKTAFPGRRDSLETPPCRIRFPTVAITRRLRQFQIPALRTPRWFIVAAAAAVAAVAAGIVLGLWNGARTVQELARTYQIDGIQIT